MNAKTITITITVGIMLLSSVAMSQEAVRQSDVGQRMVNDGYPFLIPQSAVEEVRAKRERIAAVGYAEKDALFTRAEYVLGRMDEQRRASEARHGGQVDAADLDFVDVGTFDGSALGVSVAIVPPNVMTSRSEGYVLQANRHIVKRIFTGTSLGTLLIDEYIGAKLYSDGQPELFIAGQPAWRSTIKYPGDKWSTSIGVEGRNGRLLIVTADRRFEGMSSESFVNLLESLVLSTY